MAKVQLPIPDVTLRRRFSAGPFNVTFPKTKNPKASWRPKQSAGSHVVTLLTKTAANDIARRLHSSGFLGATVHSTGAGHGVFVPGTARVAVKARTALRNPKKTPGRKRNANPRSTTPAYRFVVRVPPPDVLAAMLWSMKNNGRPTTANIEKWVYAFVKSQYKGGSNHGLSRRIVVPLSARVIRQKGRVEVAAWTAPPFTVLPNPKKRGRYELTVRPGKHRNRILGWLFGDKKKPAGKKRNPHGSFTTWGPYRSTNAIRAANKRLGRPFFDRETMRFFDSKVHAGVYGGRFFITSEQFVGSDGVALPREYQVRAATDEGEIETGADFTDKFATVTQAKARARKMAVDLKATIKRAEHQNPKRGVASTKNPVRSSTVKIGDRVRYSSSWLRSAGIYTGDLPFARGVVTRAKPFSPGSPNLLVTIRWDTPDVPEKVLATNLDVQRGTTWRTIKNAGRKAAKR